MYLAIVGGRDFNDYSRFSKIVDDYIRLIGVQPSVIVSGGANGVDSMAERYAREHEIHTLIFKPEYEKYRRAAPLKRNTQIIETASHVLALPTKTSRGTYDSINKAKKLGKIISVLEV